VRRRVFWVVALLLAAAGIGVLAFGGIGKNLVYYWSPSELVKAGDKAYGALVRLGGLVKPGSVKWTPKQTDLHFEVTDGTHNVKVHASAVPPQMFRAGIGVVIEGRLARSGVFESNRLMVKHGNDYQPPDPNKKPDIKALMKTVAEEDSKP